MYYYLIYFKIGEEYCICKAIYLVLILNHIYLDYIIDIMRFNVPY